MKKHLTWSNAIFVVIVFLFLYKPTRVWFTRQLSFSPSIKTVEKSKQITDYNWQLKGLNTSNINFENLKGKVIFVNFWATWCPPCIAEMPSVQAFYNDYKDKVAFVFITSDDWQTVEKFYKENNYDLPVHQSVTNLPKDLPEVPSIPRTFVIDKNGYIRIDKTGSADWNSDSFREHINKLLN